MGIYAHALLFYGFIRSDETEELFKKIEEVHDAKEGTETYDKDDFFSRHYELQQKYDVELTTYDANSDAIILFRLSVSDKQFDYEKVFLSDLEKTEEYKKHFQAFLFELDIDEKMYMPDWYIVTYLA